MSVTTLKSAALALLGAGGANWTTGALARNASNKPVSPLHPSAVKYDVMGALIRAHVNTGSKNLADYHGVYSYLRSKIPAGVKNKDVELYNDKHTWAEVSALFA